jgi:hypothetical protein
VFVPRQWIAEGSRVPAELDVGGRRFAVDEVTVEGETGTDFALYGYLVNGESARTGAGEKWLEVRRAFAMQSVDARVYVISASGPKGQLEQTRARVRDAAHTVAQQAGGGT